MTTTTRVGTPGSGIPRVKSPSRRDRGGAHRFPCRAKTRMSRAEGASRPRSLAPPARLPDWPTDGRRRTTRTRTRAGFSPLDASDVPKKVCLQHDSITRDRTSSLHRVARAAARAHPRLMAPACPPRSRARAASRRSSRSSRSSRRARPRRLPPLRARPPRRVARDRRVRRVRGERGGPPRRARVRGGQAPREARRGRSASRTPPTPSARSSARSTPRAVPEGAGYGTHTRPSPSPPAPSPSSLPAPTTTPLLLLLLLLLDDDAVRPGLDAHAVLGVFDVRPERFERFERFDPNDAESTTAETPGAVPPGRCSESLPEVLARACNATSAAAEDDSWLFQRRRGVRRRDERRARARRGVRRARVRRGSSTAKLKTVFLDTNDHLSATVDEDDGIPRRLRRAVRRGPPAPRRARCRGGARARRPGRARRHEASPERGIPKRGEQAAAEERRRRRRRRPARGAATLRSRRRRTRSPLASSEIGCRSRRRVRVRRARRRVLSRALRNRKTERERRRRLPLGEGGRSERTAPFNKPSGLRRGPLGVVGRLGGALGVGSVRPEPRGGDGGATGPPRRRRRERARNVSPRGGRRRRRVSKARECGVFVGRSGRGRVVSARDLLARPLLRRLRGRLRPARPLRALRVGGRRLPLGRFSSGSGRVRDGGPIRAARVSQNGARDGRRGGGERHRREARRVRRRAGRGAGGGSPGRVLGFVGCVVRLSRRRTEIRDARDRALAARRRARRLRFRTLEALVLAPTRRRHRRRRGGAAARSLARR